MIECCSMEGLKHFIETAQPNTYFKYYTGYHLEDSLYSFKVGQFCYEQSASGNIYLVKNRNMVYPGMFNYYVIKASRFPRRNLIPISTEEFKKRYKLTGGDKRYVRTKSRGARADEQIKGTNQSERKEERQRPQGNGVDGSTGLSAGQNEGNGHGSSGPGGLQNTPDSPVTGLVSAA